MDVAQRTRPSLAGLPLLPRVIAREREKHLLANAVSETLSGQGGLLIIGGEAGIGKTALVNWASNKACEDGICVLSSYCYADTTPRPYGVWIDVLRDAARHNTSPHLPAEHVVESSLAKIDSHDSMDSLVRQSLDAVTQQNALMLVLEDMQWADAASIELLDHLSRNIRSHPALILVTYRDDIRPEHELYRHMPSIARQASVQRMALQRLEEGDVGLLAREYCTLAPTDEHRLIEFLVRRAEGNPFFTLELLNMLIERGILQEQEGTWELHDLGANEVPGLIQQVVSVRLDSLQPATRTMLETASVAGDRIPLGMLQQIYPETAEMLDQALQEAIQRRVIRLSADEQEARFSHQLVQQAIYDTVSPLRKQQLHRAIGETLAQRRHPDPDTVAGHMTRAGDARALGWLVRAAENAHQLHAPASVLDRCRQAIALAERLGVTTPPDIHRLEGLALDTLADFDGARDSLERALEIASDQGDHHARWRALFDLGSIWTARDYSAALTYIRQALEIAQGIDDERLIAQSLMRLGNAHTNIEEFDEGIGLLHEALQTFEGLNDEHGIAATLDLLGLASLLNGNPVDSLTYYQRAVPILRQLDDRRTLINALPAAAVAEFGGEHALFFSTIQHRGPTNIDNRYALVDEAIQIASEIGHHSAEALSLALRSSIAHRFGDLDTAMENARRAVAIAHETAHPQWQILGLCSLGALYLDLHVPEMAMHAFSDAMAHTNPIGSSFLTGLTRSYLALACIRAGHPERAESLIRPEIDLGRPPETTSQRNYWIAWIELDLHRGTTDSSMRMLDDLEATLAGDPDHRHPRMLELRARLLLAAQDYTDAERTLRTARNTAETNGYLMDLLAILPTLQASLLGQGRIKESRSVRTTARRTAKQLAGRLERVDPDLAEHFRQAMETEVLADLAFKPRQTRAGQSNTLTRRELDVLQLVARGLTDVEVGEYLFISHRTVSQHLRSIYAKLEVNNRTAAVHAAEQLGQLRDNDE